MHLKNERNHSEHGECLCWWELWNANQSLACGFSHCVKQRLYCCSHEAWQCSLYSAALNIFLTNGAEKSLLPGNNLRHIPLNFKSLKNSEIHTRRIFLITHLQPPITPACSLTSCQDRNVMWFYRILLGFRYWFHRTKLMLGSTSGYKTGSILVWFQAHTAAGYCME